LKPVLLRLGAKKDFREATAWYRARNTEVADRFVTSVARTLELLRQFPLTGGFVPGVDDPEIRRMPVHSFPYHVVFVRLADRISVLAIAHDRRKPGYWDE
jgi:plasmid stabilization system protein ParE